MKGTCTLDAFPADALPCGGKELMPVATGDGRSLRRGFSIVLALDKFDRDKMRPGMAVKVEMHRQPEAGLVVPRGAGALREGQEDRARAAHVGRLARGRARLVRRPRVHRRRKGLGDGESVQIGGAP